MTWTALRACVSSTAASASRRTRWRRSWQTSGRSSPSRRSNACSREPRFLAWLEKKSSRRCCLWLRKGFGQGRRRTAYCGLLRDKKLRLRCSTSGVVESRTRTFMRITTQQPWCELAAERHALTIESVRLSPHPVKRRLAAPHPTGVPYGGAGRFFPGCPTELDSYICNHPP